MNIGQGSEVGHLAGGKVDMDTVDCKATVDGKEIVVSIPLKDIQEQLKEVEPFKYQMVSNLGTQIRINEIGNDRISVNVPGVYLSPDKVYELIIALCESVKGTEQYTPSIGELGSLHENCGGAIAQACYAILNGAKGYNELWVSAQSEIK